MIGLTEQPDYSICHIMVRLFICTVCKKFIDCKYLNISMHKSGLSKEYDNR